jgi:hypothetical protein
MKINMCSVGDKVPSAAYFQAWRRMLDNATVTRIYPVKDTFFSLTRSG